MGDFSPCQEAAIWLTCQHAKTAEQKVAFCRRDQLQGRYFLFCLSQWKMPVEDDFLNNPKEVSRTHKAKLAALMRRYAEHGEITFDQRCHRLKGRVREFWVIKAHQHRLYFFKEGNYRIIITHGFVKKTDKLRSEEEDRMLSIYDTYNNLNLYK